MTLSVSAEVLHSCRTLGWKLRTEPAAFHHGQRCYGFSTSPEQPPAYGELEDIPTSWVAAGTPAGHFSLLFIGHSPIIRPPQPRHQAATERSQDRAHTAGGRCLPPESWAPAAVPDTGHPNRGGGVLRGDRPTAEIPQTAGTVP